MEYINQTGNILIYQFNDYSSDFFFVIFGIVFILVYFLKLPFYWLRNSKFPASRKIALVLGIIFVILGSHQVLSDTRTKTVFDKSQQKLFIVTESRFEEKGKQEYDLKKIESVKITKGSETRNDYKYFLEVQFDNDKSILLSENVEDVNYSEFEKQGKQIASFLNVPLKLVSE